MPLDITKYINTSQKLKIWTLITHGLIVGAVGHGAAFYFLLELAGLFKINSGFTPLGYLVLPGQALIIISMFQRSARYKIIIHIAGLLFLWSAIVYFKLNIQKGMGDVISDLFMAPFAVCTIITFAGKPVKILYGRFLGKQ